MYLSNLDILGFKSFAQKVHLTFDEGITAIVGPNGCGKTNVVDAIRWVLGEQRPTTLRSDKMEDVIFNGTKSRKPLSVAEVSLTIENSRGILPSEYTEVTITRRVYRSGESEYFLNRAPCRLKDIRDLFMDTGMGSDAYSVIELKMVETILSDKADERRRLFEEAAGVTKYKYRRKEAYRRLETVRQDLLRVGDIVGEVQKAVHSLERQAHKAQRYNEYARRLQDLEIELLQREFAAVTARIGPLRDQLAVAVDERNRIDVVLKQEEALLDVLRQELEDLEGRSAETQQSLARRQDAIHALEQSRATATERRRSLRDNIARFDREKKELLEQRERLEGEQAKRSARLEALRRAKAEAAVIWKQKQSELDTYDAQVSAKRAEFTSCRDQLIGILHRISELKAQASRTRARIENLHGRIDFVTEEEASLRHEQEKNGELIARLSAEDKELRRSFAQAQVRAQEMEEQQHTLQRMIEQQRNRVFELRTSIERKRARRDFLKGLVETYDGLSEGARFLLTNTDWNRAVHSTVGEALHVDPRHRLAVESSLGEAAGFVIVDTAERAYEAIAYLKKEGKGKATFICLDRIPASLNGRQAVRSPGVIGWADALVRVEEQYRPLFGLLLEGTLIVEDVATAVRVVTEDPSVRCVTLEGELVTGTGMVRGGSTRQDEGGYIGRRDQLEDIDAELEQLERQRASADADLQRLTGELETIDLKKFHDEAREIEQRMTSVEIRIAQLEFEKNRAAGVVERNRAEIERLRGEIDGLTKELNETDPALQQLESRKSALEQESGVLASELETMEVLWNEYARKAQEAHLAVVSLESDEQGVRKDHEHASSVMAALEQTYHQRTAEVTAAVAEIEELGSRLQETERALEEERAALAALRDDKQTVDEEYAGKRTRMHEIEMRLKDERLKHEGSLQASYELEMKVQELTMKAEGLKSRAREEFEIELEHRDFPDAEAFDLTAAREEARQLKEKIRGLGAVNFAAFDEYKSEKERLDFVNAQRKDLEESEQTLLTTIEEINTTAQRRFLETFEHIRENFIRTFRTLFDEGDECDLKLEDGVDPLEARIEITAKPRGKRPTSIDLLSGGEKTLLAIALLFAIYLVKPSPFCILDEVDAPLDDSNIDRFTRILHRFSDNTQFVVVTHNKQTMEAAHAMYGVTMEEEGVSKLVSVRFNEATETQP